MGGSGAKATFNMPSIPGIQAIQDYATDSMLKSIFRTPNADKHFIRQYNAVAAQCQSMADMYNNSANTCDIFGGFNMYNSAKAFNAISREARVMARFYGTLAATKVDTEADPLEGLDYKVIKDLKLKKDELLYIPGDKGSNPDFFSYLSHPEAGHGIKFVHWDNKMSKSFIMNMRKYGGVFVLNKLPAIAGVHSDFSLDDVFERDVIVTNYIYNQTKKKVNKFAICQAGWESFVGSIIGQDKCRSLFTSVAPMNWHSRDLSDLTTDINPANPEHAEEVEKQLDRIENLIKRNGGVMPGAHNGLGFASYSKKQLFDIDMKQLYQDCMTLEDDNTSKKEKAKAESGIARFIDLRTKFWNTQPMGGEYFGRNGAGGRLWRDNDMYNNRMVAMGQKIILKNFKIPHHVEYFNTDNITSFGQASDHVIAALFEKYMESGEQPLAPMARKRFEEILRGEYPLEGLMTIGTNPEHISIGESSGGHLASMNGSKGKFGVNAWLITLSHPDFGKKGFNQQVYFDKVKLALMKEAGMA